MAALGACSSAPSKYCYGSVYAVGDFVGSDMTQKVRRISVVRDPQSKATVAWFYDTTTGPNLQLNLKHVGKNTYAFGIDDSVNYLSGGIPTPSYFRNAEIELMRFYSEDDVDDAKMPAEFVRLRKHKPLVELCPAKAPQ